MIDKVAMFRRHAAAVGLASALLFCAAAAMRAQANPAGTAAPAQAVSRQRGTVKSIEGSTMMLTTDDGQQMTIAVTPAAKIVQLPPGSTDLKSAQPITLTDVAAGDRVLVIGAAGAGGESFQAGRVILMKSTDIAAQHAREEADWRQGSGGIVTAVDAGTGTVSMSSRGKTVAVQTTSSTIFRRYPGDSVKFQDAKRGSIDQVRPGDQMRVRGTRSADGGSLAADEVVSGRFENLSGTLTAVDASAGTVRLQDLATKKPVTVALTANSAIHSLPPGAAAALAGSGQPSAQARPAGGSQPSASPTTGAATGESAGTHRGGGGDLSQMVARLPQISVSDLHVGDAVLVVATPASPDNTSVTAITLVSGVQSLLSAAQGRAPAVTLSPWSLGQNGAEEGGGAQ